MQGIQLRRSLVLFMSEVKADLLFMGKITTRPTN